MDGRFIHPATTARYHVKVNGVEKFVAVADQRFYPQDFRDPTDSAYFDTSEPRR